MALPLSFAAMFREQQQILDDHAQSQPAANLVEVLISREPQHVLGTRLGMPSEQAVSQSDRIEPTFVLCADGCCLALALVKVAIHLRAPAQVESDDSVDVP